jgi:hypothetical protein
VPPRPTRLPTRLSQDRNVRALPFLSLTSLPCIHILLNTRLKSIMSTVHPFTLSLLASRVALVSELGGARASGECPTRTGRVRVERAHA